MVADGTIVHVNLKLAEGVSTAVHPGRVLETEGTDIVLGVEPAVAKAVKEGLIKQVKVGDMSFAFGFVRVPSASATSTRPAGCRANAADNIPGPRALRKGWFSDDHQLNGSEAESPAKCRCP